MNNNSTEISSTHAATAVTQRNRPRWKQVITDILHYLVPVAITVLMMVWMFRKIDFHEMIHVIRTECDFFWIAMMMLITALSHTIRGTRWGIQLRGAGLKRLPNIIGCISIYGAYALNLLFPYLGETWRCIFMAKEEDAKISTVVGTDIGDRGTDLVCILSITGLCLIVAGNYMKKFLVHYSLVQRIIDTFHDVWLWAVIIIVIGGVWLLMHLMRGNRLVRRIDGTLGRVWNGFRCLFTMKGKFAYVVLSIGIWVCYFSETYMGFLAFPFTRELIADPGSCYGLIPGLVVFVFGAFSMAIPSNGGLGPWNIAVMFALSLYGVSNTQGAAYSVVMWGCQSLMLIALGVFSAIYISFYNKRHPVGTNKNTET